MVRYDSYKDSGVDWISHIPTSWLISKLKYNIHSRLSYGVLKPDKYFESDSVPIIRTVDLSDNYDLSTFDRISPELSNEFSRTIVQKGDVLISVVGTIGKTMIVDENLEGSNLSRSVCRIILKNTLQNKLLIYLFQSEIFLSKVFELSSGSIQSVLNLEDLSNFTFPSPPLSEQQQIVSFLDTKTSLIDSLIEKTQLKIELLKEKRTSLINEVVTKGLNPNVEMKDSGVEWIGEIPSGWKFLKLWLIIKSSELGGNYNGSSENEGIPMMKMGNIERGKINLNKIEYVDEPYKESHILKFGDFLFNTRNSIDLVGKVCVWRNELEKSIYNSNILRIDFKDSVNVDFMNYQFNSKSILDVLRLISKGTTSVSGIYYKDLSKIEVVLPPLSEQQQIVDYLDKQTGLIDKTISIEEKRIQLLKEYSQSLISEVVTGKRKVVE